MLFTNIGSLTTNAGPEIIDAAMLVIDGKVAWVGPAADAPAADRATDVGGRAVIPGFVDSHAHLVFAGDRSSEFAARMAGEAYSAGGIATTVAATRAASDAELDANVTRLARELRASGVTTFETKSGYGLTVADEARSLRIGREHTPHATFLGAHVVPKEFAHRSDAYVQLVIDEMIPACAPYAWGIDVFCDRGAFDGDQSRAILEAGKAAGLLPRIHANQLQAGPGVQVAAAFGQKAAGQLAFAAAVGALSADHCTHLTDADIELLAEHDIVATLLPGAEFSTRSPYPNARRLIDAGVTVALATDCNPGSSYTTSMPLMIALAVKEMHMSVDEALRAATLGGAKALGRTDVGHLDLDANADFVVLDAPNPIHLAYRPGVNLVHATWVNGEHAA